MQRQASHGVMHGKVRRVDVCNVKAPYPVDHINRQFRAERPNQFWGAPELLAAMWV